MRPVVLLCLCVLLWPFVAGAQTLTCTKTDTTTVVVSWTPPLPDPKQYWTHTGYLLDQTDTAALTDATTRAARLTAAGHGPVRPAEQAVVSRLLPASAKEYTAQGLAEGTWQFALRAVHRDPQGTERPSGYAPHGDPPPCIVVVGPPPPPGDLTARPQ